MKRHSSSGRVKLWNYVTANLAGSVFRVSYNKITHATGISPSYTHKIIEEWVDVGAIDRVAIGCYRVNFVPDTRSSQAPDWSAGAIESLDALRDIGLSRQEISHRLGVTLNAVHGKLYRLALDKSPSP
jgi:hypothetical protein